MKRIQDTRYKHQAMNNNQKQMTPIQKFYKSTIEYCNLFGVWKLVIVTF